MEPIDAGPPGPALAPDRITCVECLGECYRLRPAPHEGDQPGDWVAYRCPDCADRFDLQIPEDDTDW